MSEPRTPRFTKVKIDPKRPRVTICYTVDNGTEEPDTYSVETKLPAHPEFVAALAALRPHVLELCELTGVGEEDIEVRGVTFTWRHEIMGAVITGLRRLAKSASPLVLNTPHKTVEPYGEDGDASQLLPGATIVVLENVQREAMEFLQGKRGEVEEKEQTEMALESATAWES